MQLLSLFFFAVRVVVSLSSINTPQSFSPQDTSRSWNRRPYTEPATQIHELKRVLSRSPMPPRHSPGTPPISRRPSIDMAALFILEDSSEDSSKGAKKTPEKKQSGPSSGKPKPDNIAKAPNPSPRTQSKKVSRPSSPHSSSGSDNGFVRLSEMATARIYGSPSSSEDEMARGVGEAQRPRLPRRRWPPSFRQRNPAFRQHYNSPDSAAESDKDRSVDSRNNSPADRITRGRSSS
ncbi:MAG: hypothetical protein GOMPHAMPRED_005991 [Gomphillus americanus]|uniref:Uncharacterized protein n=1 Tax=Gomphillus americanus TaxID=1940652 RepID=A0A8H3ERX4_9LECA|nr:MAG: hypothetical protein GOMPHAMPRED_005991 [Gomphillus americanus]